MNTIKFLIFYASLQIAPSPGVIVIYQEKVKAFDVEWVIDEMNIEEQYGDKIYRGQIKMNHKGERAKVDIMGKDVVVTLLDKTIFLEQDIHKTELYTDIE